MQFKVTAHNYKRKGFSSNMPSITVPGQVVPVRRILERFRAGQSVQTFPAVYNPDLPPGYEKLDKIGKIEAAREQAEIVDSLRSRLQKQAIDEARKYAEIERSRRSRSQKQAIEEDLQNDEKPLFARERSDVPGQ